MLNAILNSKDISADCTKISNFRDLYNDIEDFFTATIFSRFLYLPSYIQSRILFELTGNNLFRDTGDLASHEFWPIWPTNVIVGRQYIEPDLFLQYQNVDVIIEAKRNDMTPHDANQIENELVAYSEQYEDVTQRKCILLAIGGGTILSKQHDDVVFCKWSRFFEAIQNVYKNSSVTQFNKVIYTDIVNGFSLHGFYPYRWLSSLDVDNSIDLQHMQSLKWS